MAESYKIKKGDTLWDIAKRIYGDGRRYKELAEFNNIANPNMIIAGKTLQIPGNESRKEDVVPETIHGDYSLESAPARNVSLDITPNAIRPYSNNATEVMRREAPMETEEYSQTVLPKDYYTKPKIGSKQNFNRDSLNPRYYKDISDSKEYRDFMAELEAEEYAEANPVYGGILDAVSVTPSIRQSLRSGRLGKEWNKRGARYSLDWRENPRYKKKQ